jgi:cell division protein FtsN
MTRRPAPRRASRREAGNTVLGLVIGIVIGLGVAMVVALFVTKATVPFVSKSARPVAATEPDGGKLPDPNKGLYSKDAPPVASNAPATSAPSPSSSSSDNTVIAPAPPNVAPGADGKAPVVDRTPPPTNITMLQAGAFSNAEDAESMRGRLALLGFESRVQPADREGGRIFRVRLGPYGRIDDLNRARQRLIENGVEATLVAPGR